eukprot:CAMPEP_0172749428 /NCGR_PEP_ID=MMETSP1074-20121228/147359_1 /TAXON_ID=2916 /ORGANISM="Ceratium fusus, Strain PA161109" /LENGTH=37 /DNA_ID= /DNA_START= /DNA_END= /DNA_ORIENTATION=
MWQDFLQHVCKQNSMPTDITKQAKSDVLKRAPDKPAT